MRAVGAETATPHHPHDHSAVAGRYKKKKSKNLKNPFNCLPLAVAENGRRHFASRLFPEQYHRDASICLGCLCRILYADDPCTTDSTIPAAASRDVESAWRCDVLYHFHTHMGGGARL